MDYVTILWSMAAAAALLLGLIHGLVWLFDRKAWANLAFSSIALSVAGIALAELGMMHADTAREWGQWVRAGHVPIFLAIVGTVLFVRLYLGTGRAWLAWTIVATRAVILLANFATYPNFNFERIEGIERMRFLGEDVSVLAAATTSPWQWLATASGLMLAVFALDAGIALWRKGGADARRKALLVGGGIVAFVSLSVLHTQLIIWGFARMPVMIALPFLITLGAMAVELSRDIVRASRLARDLTDTDRRLEVAASAAGELRGELAHVGRVSMLGQLASALAHELSQPLSAILHNAEAAEMLLASPSPDLEELRAIITDIHRDDRRAGEVIERLRALLKRRRMEFQAIAVASLVEDVSTLVLPDAAARNVKLECLITAGLPRVAGDRVHLSQVLINLMINAMDAMSQTDGPRRSLIVAARLGAQRTVEVAVTDFGGGIPAQILARIFEPFFTTKPGGLGMGLAVSRTIIEAHGGRLWAENHASGGATFRFTLPAAEDSGV